MNKLKFYLFALLLSGFLSGCKSHSTGYTKVIIFTSAPLKSKLYISDIPFSDEKKMIVDSAIIINNRDSIILYVPDKVERLYSIDVKGLRLGIIFINDAPVIRVHANYFSNKYYFTGSKASLSLKKFEDKQLVKAIELRSAKRSIDSLKALHVNKQFLTSAVTRFNTGLQDFYKQYINYADTVSSPAAFMKVYNKVDFGDD